MHGIFAFGLWVITRFQFATSAVLIALLYALPIVAALALMLRQRSVSGIEMLFWVVLPMLVATYFFSCFAVRMSRNERRARDTLERVGSGDLTVRLSHTDTAQSGRQQSIDRSGLDATLAQTVSNLSGIVQQVRDTAERVNAASRKISAGSLDLAERSNEQAVTLEQTSSTIQQIGDEIQRNTRDSISASRMADVAGDVAARGTARIREVSDGMQRIDKSARQMGDIIGTIEGIAFQTNILALNAAVEAARAGEQGRGFAVVATEVRALAQRSATAAKEIRKLIQTSQNEITSGAKETREAVEVIEQLAEKVQGVNKVLGDISGVSRDQSQRVDEIILAVSQLDKVTQQNTDFVDQMAHAAQSLEAESMRLADVVGMFKSDNSESRELAVALVKRGVARFAVAPQEQVLREINNPQGSFIDGDLYLYAVNLNATLLAHGGNPSLVGMNQIDQTDADGHFFTRDMIEAAQKRGRGWIDYKWKDPKSGRLDAKSAYYELVSEMVIGCGIYKSRNIDSPMSRAGNSFTRGMPNTSSSRNASGIQPNLSTQNKPKPLLGVLSAASPRTKKR